MRYVWILFVALVSCNSQETNKDSQPDKPLDTCGYIPYSQDPNISDKNGSPRKLETQFLPREFQYKHLHDTLVIDSSTSKMCSEALYHLREPVLNNYYLNKTIYRLTVIPGTISNHSSISFIKENNEYYILTKMLANRYQSYSTELHVIGSKGNDSIIPYRQKIVSLISTLLFTGRPSTICLRIAFVIIFSVQ
jgi:hypothetical protein